jgi:hypothetical protein
MNVTRWFSLGLITALAAPAAWADPGALEVEVWTDRGNDAVYQPGDAMEVRVRSSDDGYLLVYEIDAEGYVRLLWPDRGSRGFVEGRQTLKVPSERSNLELVVEEPTGQGHLVALVSRDPFRELPWYLRPYDLQAEGTGYAGDPDEEEGITREGRIVGDPFVAMERVRRAVLVDSEDPESFGTAYTTYYVHEQVRYPRYLCYDCHRPGHWAWWDGFDPYYTRCSTFDFRVNWGWNWGPSYWYGYVPYYYYVVRYDCPPRYRLYTTRTIHYSSWDGWKRWSALMGGSVRRYKSAPPSDYVAPSKYKDRARWPKETPPGLVAARDVAPGRNGGGLRPSRDLGRTGTGRGDAPGIERPRDVMPRGERVREVTPRDDRSRGVSPRGEREMRPGIERPRDVVRGGMSRRPADSGTRVGRGGISEPRREVRGTSSRQNGERSVARGRYQANDRPAREAPRRESVERPRDPGSSGSKLPKAENREERRDESRAPERRSEPRQESRSMRGGGGRGSGR